MTDRDIDVWHRVGEATWIDLSAWLAAGRPPDPLRPPETDEEPWAPELPELPELPDPDAGVDLLDGAVVATSTWLVLTTLTAAALAVVLLALLMNRRFR